MTPSEIRAKTGRVATDEDVDAFLLVLSLAGGRDDEVGMLGRAAEVLRACWIGSSIGPGRPVAPAVPDFGARPT